MKTLLLMRHAKSSWTDPTMTDHERTLNERGQRDAPRMGRHLVSLGLQPTFVLSSTATRAAETARAVAAEIPDCGEIVYFDDLYHAPPSSIVDVIGRAAAAATCLLVVCHNPGIEELVERLAGFHERMSTAAVARFEFEGDWGDFTVDTPTSFVAVDRPKEIDD